MATTEIEKLERRYAENPQGLTFAPLAEVHRKNGEVARALELLKAGLELHPNYIPASIVLGRCHWDSGDLPAAEAAFSHVLRLDDENVIALKSLADINERLERFSDAQRWLNRLISVDRSNEEARQQLAADRDGQAAARLPLMPRCPSGQIDRARAVQRAEPDPAEQPSEAPNASLPADISASTSPGATDVPEARRRTASPAENKEADTLASWMPEAEAEHPEPKPPSRAPVSGDTSTEPRSMHGAA